MVGNRITRWNVHQLSPYDQAQWRRARRAETAAMQERNANMANSFAAIRNTVTSETGNIVSRSAMQRISRQALSKLA